MTIETPSRKRASIGRVVIDEPGRHEVSVTGFTEARRFHMDQASFGAFVGSLLGFICPAFVIGAVAVIWGIVALVRSMRTAPTANVSP